MASYFVTGTGTGVGKTTVTVGLARAAHARGLRVACLKPIETGWSEANADAVRLQRAAGGHQGLAEVCPYQFELPASPERAAAVVHRTISLSTILRTVAAIQARNPELFLVEGAGGSLVPITPEALMVDLAVSLGFPTLIVARSDLGTINHTLLTIESLLARDLTIRGVILSSVTPTPVEVVKANARDIERFSNTRVLGHLPHHHLLNDTELASHSDTILSALLRFT